MKTSSLPGIFLAGFVAAGALISTRSHENGKAKISFDYQKKKYSKAEKAAFNKERALYEFNLLKDPGTNRIPATIRQQEFLEARTIQAKEYASGSGTQGSDNLNDYAAAGPDSVGGRTRTVAYDVRYNGTTNRIIISGSVSGGIFRSTDGGTNWTRVSPENDIHNLSSLAQDPRPGFQDTWYAGGGEAIANSASGSGAAYLSQGVWKSSNNGLTWSKLALQVTDINGTVLGGGALEVFDSPFDFVHKIIVHPANGHVYVAGHRRLVRSTNGGTNWNVVFTGQKGATSSTGQMDVISTPAGVLYLGVNGAFPDQPLRGVFTSTSGDANSWTRIAGGSTLGVDSVAEWRGNSYDIDQIVTGPPRDTTFVSRRILLAAAPSNQNIIYATYENGLSQEGDDGNPEADLYQLNTSVGRIWSNRSANMPDFEGQLDGVDPLELQDGYNFMITVKPDDPNTVFIGGTNLFRSTNGFSTKDATAWLGGYGQNFASRLSFYSGSHPDMHDLAFMPNNGGSNPNFLKAINAHDGGLSATDNVMSTGTINPVTWRHIRNYQTLQYYHVGISPHANNFEFIGGAQDNGTQVKEEGSNNHIRIFSGDGGAASIGVWNNTTYTLYGSSQLGTMYRLKADASNAVQIHPNGLTANSSGGFGEFVTNFKMSLQNTEHMYYINYNRLFRTDSASKVTRDNWVELTGVRSNVNPGNPGSGTNVGIRALEPSMGPYQASHALYIGTSNGRIFRLNDPQNTPANTSAVEITPPELEQLRTAGTAVNISDIAVNPNNDDEVLAVVSNYSVTSGGTAKTDFNIWWTNNAKSAAPTWRKADGNLILPSIRACMIVTKKQGANSVTEYYVGTSVGLYSAVNIGSTLQGGGAVNWVREGGNILNYSVITSLDYRPQDNVLLVGTHGNGLYYAQIGSPDYRPNQNTPIDEPTRNDKNFIQQIFPSYGVKDRVEFRTGNMFTIKKLVIRVTNLAGQTVVRSESPYSNGAVNVTGLPKGAYILTITSEDYKQQYVRKFLKD